jgi:hypothetical protein
MAFLSGVHYLLPVGIVNYVQTLKEPRFEANFTKHKDANPETRQKGISRFPDLPPNWGPKSRAKKRTTTPGSEGATLKRQRKSHEYETTNVVAAAAKAVANKAAAAVAATAKAEEKEKKAAAKVASGKKA